MRVNRLRAFIDGGAASALPRPASPLDQTIRALLSAKFRLSYGEVGLSRPLLRSINEELMAVLSLVAGLEIKREVFEGDLSPSSRPTTTRLLDVGDGRLDHLTTKNQRIIAA